MSWRLHIGQMVVCILNHPSSSEDKFGRPVTWPARGCVYTIRNIVFAHGDGQMGLVFEEIRNPAAPGDPPEVAFAADAFRPVAPTSIEDLKELLAPAPEEVVAA